MLGQCLYYNSFMYFYTSTHYVNAYALSFFRKQGLTPRGLGLTASRGNMIDYLLYNKSAIYTFFNINTPHSDQRLNYLARTYRRSKTVSTRRMTIFDHGPRGIYIYHNIEVINIRIFSFCSRWSDCTDQIDTSLCHTFGLYTNTFFDSRFCLVCRHEWFQCELP